MFHSETEFRHDKHSPETASIWVSRWSDSPVGHYEMEAIFYRLSERFPSVKNLDRWAIASLPLWQLGVEAGFLSKEVTVSVRELERWMVPNKLTITVMAMSRGHYSTELKTARSQRRKLVTMR
ncbi:plasmid SOS inhibition protein A [Erwinia persicina]|uniref:plasmid SOS inhibition protein A n=1 Tax=Erwinia persicina TaxID=55211 RepID=UPI001FCEC713|nr:plasmid SOS inhibition protein A [Erwinia persicina]